MVLLTNREAAINNDILVSHKGAEIVSFKRADYPTANQVAVIWVDEEGHAPEIHGMF